MTQFTIPQAAAHLNRPESTVRRWIQEGRLRGHKIGNVWVVEWRTLKRFRVPKWRNDGRGKQG